MKILHFEAEKLHGYLSFSLDFQSDLTFLTGINGSGKTSAIRCIRSLLAPSVVALAELDYSRIGVTVSESDETVTISSWRQGGEIWLSLSGASETLRIPELPETYESLNRYSKRRKNYYRDQETKNAENGTLAGILRLPTPMYLDIERRYQEGVNIRRTLSGIEQPAGTAGVLSGSSQDGPRAAQLMAEDAYREFLAARSKATDVLKQDIVLAAFRPSRQAEFGGFSIPSSQDKAETLRRIVQNESTLPSVLSQIGISDKRIESTVLSFFRNARSAVDRVPAIEEFPREGGQLSDSQVSALQSWSAFAPQIRQIDKLAELIEAYNKEIASLFEPIRSYLDTVNGFLKEAEKELVLDSTGGMSVRIREDGTSRPIYQLSSGEKQMVVILTHLAFNRQAKLANVLIIDEPELSLHIRWQELFVDAVMRASPGLQVILATHSPSIIRGRVDKCIDVSEARHSDSLFGRG